MQDTQLLLTWIRYFLIVAAVFSTSFPVLYAFSPWHESQLGRLLMLQAVSLAAAINITLLFNYWHPKNIAILLWVDLFILAAIAASTGALTWMLWQVNHSKWIVNRETGERFLRKEKK